MRFAGIPRLRGGAFTPVMALFGKTVTFDNQGTTRPPSSRGRPHSLSARAFESPMVLVSGGAAKMSQR